MSARTGPGRPELYPPAPSAHSTDPDSWGTPNEPTRGASSDCATVQSDQLRTFASRNCEAVRRPAHCVILALASASVFHVVGASVPEQVLMTSEENVSNRARTVLRQVEQILDSTVTFKETTTP